MYCTEVCHRPWQAYEMRRSGVNKQGACIVQGVQIISLNLATFQHTFQQTVQSIIGVPSMNIASGSSTAAFRLGKYCVL